MPLRRSTYEIFTVELWTRLRLATAETKTSTVVTVWSALNDIRLVVEMFSNWNSFVIDLYVSTLILILKTFTPGIRSDLNLLCVHKINKICLYVFERDFICLYLLMCFIENNRVLYYCVDVFESEWVNMHCCVKKMFTYVLVHIFVPVFVKIEIWNSIFLDKIYLKHL